MMNPSTRVRFVLLLSCLIAAELCLSYNYSGPAVLRQTAPVAANELEERYPPPLFIHKVPIGQSIYPFSLIDLDGHRWDLPELNDKPVIILTGHHEVRFDIAAWGKALHREFVVPQQIHLLWVVNLCGHCFTDHFRRAENWWREFRAPIPVALDRHAQVGRNRRIDYRIPNIIGIDRAGKVAFHEMAPLNDQSQKLVRAKLRSLLKTGGFGKYQ